MTKILIVEDDIAIQKGLEAALKAEDYDITTASDGQKGFELASKDLNDLIILDIMLPFKNGLDICRDLRGKGLGTPIIMLTSRKDEIDKVVGLEIGADDYITKPFSIRELQARIKALLRRSTGKLNEVKTYTFGDVNVDVEKQEVTKGGQQVKLSVREFTLLKYFISHECQVITRNQLLDEVWGYDVFPTTRTIDNYVLSLRKKIEDDPAEPAHLLTIHTAGYKFVP